MDSAKLKKMTTEENIDKAEKLLSEMTLMCSRMLEPKNNEQVRGFGHDLYGLTLLAGIGVECLKEMHRQGRLDEADEGNPQ